MQTRIDPDAGQEAGTEAQASTLRRVLVVDDHPDTADMTQLLLESRGHVVMTAYDGRSALDVVETFRPDVVLVDISLPDFDGYELATRLRQVPNAHHAALFAVTGWDDPAHRLRTHEHGFVAHLVKPFDLNLVLELIADTPRVGEGPTGA